MIQEALEKRNVAVLPVGEYWIDPVFISNGTRNMIKGCGTRLITSGACFGKPVIRVEGAVNHSTTLDMDSVEIVSPDTQTIPLVIYEARRHLGQAVDGQGNQRPGTDPGYSLRNCHFWGHTSEAIVALRGAELGRIRDSIFSQDRACGTTLTIENLSSTTQTLLSGCSIVNYGGGYAVRTIGNVQELTLDTCSLYSESGGIVATPKGPVANGNFYLDRLMMHNVRSEGRGPALSADEAHIRWAVARGTFGACEDGSHLFILPPDSTLTQTDSFNAFNQSLVVLIDPSRAPGP